jgi:zinc transporter, ZIP family
VSAFIIFFNELSAVWQVLIYASLTALATGLGAIPFFFVKDITKKWIGLGDAFAAGLMLTASFRLIEEGMDYNLWRLLLGICVGMVIITWSRNRLSDNGELAMGKLEGASALKALMIVGVMTIHSFAEGVGVGVSFGGGREFGTYISAAIAIHNIPEGLAISMVLISRGVSVWKSMFWSVFSSVPQPLLAIPSFLFVDTFKPFLPFGLGFAAGAMIWMVVSELLPDAFADAKKQQVAISTVIGVVVMVLLQQII